MPSAVSSGTAHAQRSSSALARRAGARPAPPRPHSSKAFCPDPSRRPPWRYPGPEGAVPHTSRPAQGGEGGHGPDPHPAPVCLASPARHGGEPRAVAEGLRGGTGGSAAALRPRLPELTPPRRRPRPLGCGRAPQPSVTQGSPPGPAHTFPIKAKKHGMARLRSGRTGRRRDGHGVCPCPAAEAASPQLAVNPWQRCECGVKWAALPGKQSHTQH